MFFLKRGVFLGKKSPRQGCTTQITELGMHQNPHFQLNPLKNQTNPEINPKTAGKKNPYLLVCIKSPNPVFAVPTRLQCYRLDACVTEAHAVPRGYAHCQRPTRKIKAPQLGIYSNILKIYSDTSVIRCRSVF